MSAAREATTTTTTTTPPTAAGDNISGGRAEEGEEDVEDDDDVVPYHLRCSICWDCPPGNAQQCRSGHLICGEDGGCLSQLRANARGRRAGGGGGGGGGGVAECPTCREELPEHLPNRCLVAEQAIALLPATCRHCAAWDVTSTHSTVNLISPRLKSSFPSLTTNV